MAQVSFSSNFDCNQVSGSHGHPSRLNSMFPSTPVTTYGRCADRLGDISCHFHRCFRLVDRVRFLVHIPSHRSQPHSRALLMSSTSLPAMQRLRSLDRSSPGFHDQVCSVFYEEEYQKCVPDLQGDDSAWLVEYLNEVRRRIILPRPAPLRLAQVLDGLNPSSPAFRKCLRELRRICGARGILPTSYTLSSHLLAMGPEPFASGGYGDVYDGTLDGSRVCVKRIRMYSRDGPGNAAKVCYRRRHLPCPPSPTNADVLPGGCDVEALDTQKHRTPTGCHHRSLPARFGLGVWRGPTELHQEEPKCRSPSACRCSRFCVYLTLTPAASCLT